MGSAAQTGLLPGPHRAGPDPAPPAGCCSWGIDQGCDRRPPGRTSLAPAAGSTPALHRAGITSTRIYAADGYDPAELAQLTGPGHRDQQRVSARHGPAVSSPGRSCTRERIGWTGSSGGASRGGRGTGITAYRRPSPSEGHGGWQESPAGRAPSCSVRRSERTTTPTPHSMILAGVYGEIARAAGVVDASD
ncbi:mismatch-specific DNA-glycosylase [Kocuria rhizophila]|nr:mismatch-specific DNA-glycosylase [Kocuria rhizophila]